MTQNLSPGAYSVNENTEKTEGFASANPPCDNHEGDDGTNIDHVPEFMREDNSEQDQKIAMKVKNNTLTNKKGEDKTTEKTGGYETKDNSDKLPRDNQGDDDSNMRHLPEFVRDDNSEQA